MRNDDNNRVLPVSTLSLNRNIVFRFSEAGGDCTFIDPHIIEHVDLVQSGSILGCMYRRELDKRTQREGRSR